MSDYLQFYKQIAKIKKILRTGWVRESIENPENVGDHSFGIAVLAMVIADKLGKQVDKEKLIIMALIHDIGELVYGDTVVERGKLISDKREEKDKKEREKLKEVFDLLGNGEKYVKIFDELIEQKTLEGQIVKQLDKLEMALQASDYEQEQNKNLEEFFINAELYIKHPLLKEIFAQILVERI